MTLRNLNEKAPSATRYASACRSPLNMGEDGPNLFLNYWNVNQTFYLEGRTTVDRFEKLMEILRSRCSNASIVEETKSIGVKLLEPEEIQ